MLINGGSPTNFNYVAFDGVTGLFVGGVVVDITTGIPVFNLAAVIPMVDKGNGAYVGQFTPTFGHSYTVVTAVYTDGTYTTVNTSRSPGASQFDSSITNFSFNYGTWDFNDSAVITATVLNLTDSTQSSFAMTHIALGIYFGQFNGSVNKQYAVTKIPADSSYGSAADSFQCFPIFTTQYIIQLPQAELLGLTLNGTLEGQDLGGVLVET